MGVERLIARLVEIQARPECEVGSNSYLYISASLKAAHSALVMIEKALVKDVENAEACLEHERLDREIAEAKSKLSPGAVKLLDEFEEQLNSSPRSEIFTDEERRSRFLSAARNRSGA